jgi:hypothetical protein
MKTITELLAEKKENKVALEKAKVEHERIDSELIKFYEGYHKKLRDLNFYARFNFYNRTMFGDIFGGISNLSAEYRLSQNAISNNLPYKSLGEGDYACIRFKAIDGKLSLRHTVSCNRQDNFHICDIPLELFDSTYFDSGDENKLAEYLDGVIAANDKAISEAVEKSKAKKRKELEAELSKLQ